MAGNKKAAASQPFRVNLAAARNYCYLGGASALLNCGRVGGIEPPSCNGLRHYITPTPLRYPFGTMIGFLPCALRAQFNSGINMRSS